MTGVIPRGIYSSGNLGMLGLRSAPIRLSEIVHYNGSTHLNVITASVFDYQNWRLRVVGTATYSTTIKEVIISVWSNGIAYYLGTIQNPVNGRHYAFPVDVFLYPGESVAFYYSSVSAGDYIKYTLLADEYPAIKSQ